jgi:AFG3 family protein
LHRDDQAFTKPYSEEMGATIDAEVRRLIITAYERTYALLSQYRASVRPWPALAPHRHTLTHNEQVEKVAERLIEREVLKHEDMETLVGPRSFPPEPPMPVDQPAAAAAPA